MGLLMRGVGGSATILRMSHATALVTAALNVSEHAEGF
jgi:hypothetical protein